MSGTPRFDFSCYGTNVRINTDTDDLRIEVEREIRGTIPGIATPDPKRDFAATFDMSRAGDGTTTILHRNEVFVTHPRKEDFYRVFNTYLRMEIAENSPELLFMHAGAVGWRGKGIILPGDSFVGKSTLVAELVKLGAEYYSDDYAVFDAEGRLHAFPREISMRADDGLYTRYRLRPEDLGSIGEKAIEVGAVWLTRYDETAVWHPEILTSGQGVLEMLQYTFAFVDRPDFSLPILNKVVTNAIIISNKRGSAQIFAKILVDFVDKTGD